MGFPGLPGYIAAKHGQVGLTYARGGQGTRLATYPCKHDAPGSDIDRFQHDIEMRATGQPREEAAKAFDALVPLGRHTTPEEIARAMLYLAADESAMVKSHTFTIDGGLSG